MKKKEEPPDLVAPEVEIAEKDQRLFVFMLSKPAFLCVGFPKDSLRRS